MDDHFRRPKQNDHAMRPPPDPRYHQPGPPPHPDPSQPPPQRHYHQPGAAGSNRQRMPSGSGAGTGNSSSSGSSRVLGGTGASAYGAYYQDTTADGAFPAGAGLTAAHGAAMGYAQQTPDYAQDARQGFAGAVQSYTSLYGVPPTASPNPVFDTTASFGGARQHSGIPMMTPDVASGPYFSGDATGAAAAAAALHGQQQSMYHHPHQHQPHQHQQHHQQHHQHHQHHQPASDRSAYGTSLASSGLGSQSQTHAQPSSSTHAESSSAAAGRDYADTHESFAAYQRSLKDVFSNITSGHLAAAADTLLGISDWLLTRVESLGLTHDDEDLYEGRVQLWTDFNHAWLGLLAKQKACLWAQRSEAQAQSQPQAPPPSHTSLVSLADLQKLARELVRLCDGVERFGLVDYDYGVWEERIMTVLTECIALYSMADDEAAGPD